ncbi:MAG: glycine cleavage system protein H [Deltaproteobacteria bacterium]|nr:glycine cleavage system protein H [Deltaproteobacteria bacterium]MBW2130597.1 glycine cleavage system protein H [Deltaproteobacteria bacterium]
MPGKAKDREKKKGIMGFQVLEKECIWMKAGVVNFRLCDNAYDCFNCPFDRGMRKAMEKEGSPDSRGSQPGWVQQLKERYRGASRPCRHYLTGHIEAPKICSWNYECYHCPYDQMMDELDMTGMGSAPAYRRISGFKMAEGYYYHMGHAWARFEHGGRVRVGLDGFATKLFGAIQDLSLPPLGAALKQDQVGWVFGRDERRAAVLSPVSGTVLAVNHKAGEYPALASQDPYREGWLLIIEPDLPKRNLKNLYFEEESYRWMERESRKLMALIGQDYEKLAATGGEVLDDLYGRYPDLGWDRLVQEFLHTEAT